ncbi:YceI family protein [Nocardia aurantiaca]|uniref:Polyisoprenoid-binding protein n=1 Tax=Nocardia aurantiaca TaxID=2675850 RepID=A0A6I3KZG9_9NOCA|nr:YceI family protein [Nocardia aurantiaca]MTE16113.1 polyisoprenoid-binding protein [Nocardia aurantiaca]
MSTTIDFSELTGDYVLDTARTRIGFIARHTMGTKVRGNFGEFEGSAHLDGDEPSKSSAQLTIQAKTIDTRNQQRDDLLGRKFLGVDDHPTITFTLTGAERFDQNNVKITGDLTVRGVTRPVTVDFELTGAKNDPQGALRVGFTGSATINRKDWGVHWRAAPGMVGSKVTLEFDVAAIRQS